MVAIRAFELDNLVLRGAGAMNEFEVDKVYIVREPQPGRAIVVWIDRGLAEIHYRLVGENIIRRTPIARLQDMLAK